MQSKDDCYHTVTKYIHVVTSIKRIHCIGGIMVSVFASSAVDRGFDPRLGQSKDYKMVCVASPVSTQHYEKEQRLVGSESE